MIKAWHATMCPSRAEEIRVSWVMDDDVTRHAFVDFLCVTKSYYDLVVGISRLDPDLYGV